MHLPLVLEVIGSIPAHNEEISVSVICRDDARLVHSPSDLDVNRMSPLQGKSPPVQVKEPHGNLDMVTCRFSPCTPECTKFTCR